MEVWKDIQDYEGLYQISNLGRVKSFCKNKEKILKIFKNNHGYCQIDLFKDGRKKSLKVHRLVAQAFIPNFNMYKEINHIDCDKTNNCVDNLEWCTRSHNVNHLPTKLKNAQSRYKKINQYDLDGNFIKTWDSIKEAKEYYKCTNFNDVLKGRKKTAKGFGWKYYKEEENYGIVK